jgi:acetyl-CoA carboxylase / biotin carboxylase 1
MLPLHDRREFVERYNDPQPPNVLNFAIRISKDEDNMPEDAWNEKLIELTNANREVLEKAVCVAYRS